MARKPGPCENYRVTVVPRAHHWLLGPKTDHERYVRACQDMIEAIKRHCDDIDSIDYDYDQTHACEYCGSTWTEDSRDYNGGCCSEDQSAFEAKGAA